LFIPTETMTDQFPDKTASLTYADRLALAVCVAVLPGSKPCQAPCNACRVNSAAVARELAAIFRERFGGSATADWLDGVGVTRTEGSQPVQQPSQVRDGTTPRQRLTMARYKREFYLCFIRRVWQAASLRRRYKACQQQ
jgi:hypothetical protein